MFFIPIWISNLLLFGTCVLSATQHVRLKRSNPVTNIQFFLMVFSIVMVLIVVLTNRTNPWVSLVFFLIAAGSLGVALRQQRMMPPMKSFE